MVSVMKATRIILLLLVAAALPVPCAAWTDPGVERSETAYYRTLRDGKVLAESKEAHLEVRPGAYAFSFRLTRGESRSLFLTEFTRGDGFRPLRFAREKTDGSGRVVVSGQILLRDNPAYGPDTCPLFGNYFALRSLCGLPEGSRLTYSCLFPGGSAFTLALRVSGQEEIRSPAGTFQCIKIEETLDMQALVGGVFGLLMKIAPIRIIPRTWYWFDVRFPHTLVMRKGVAGPPPGDFIVVDELVRHE